MSVWETNIRVCSHLAKLNVMNIHAWLNENDSLLTGLNEEEVLQFISQNINRLDKRNSLAIRKTNIFYHGNKDKDMIPTYGKGDEFSDYGQGFYLTTIKELGKEWAWSQFSSGLEAYLHTYNFNWDGLAVLDLTDYSAVTWMGILLTYRKLSESSIFNLDTQNIKKFISKYSISTDTYDVIIGYRADDKMFLIAEAFVGNVLSGEGLTEALHSTEKAFSHLTIEGKPQSVPGSYRVKSIQRYNVATSYVHDLINKDANRVKRTLFVDYIRGVQDV